MEKRIIEFGEWMPASGLKKYFNQIIKTRRLTYGPICQKLEKDFGEITGNEFNNFCSSGTAALFAAIGTLKNLYPKRAEERKVIILPAQTFISDWNVVVLNGFTPFCVDIASNYNMSLTGLESILKIHHKDIFAVMPSSLFGRPVDGKSIRNLIDAYCPEAFFILDSCENVASKYDGEFPEYYADFTAYSFYLSHLLIAGAAGGMISTNNEKYAIQSRSYLNHGRQPDYVSIDDDDNLEAAKLHDIAAKRFIFTQNALNFRLGELDAAVALSMLEDDFMGQLKKREENALKIHRMLSQFELRLPSINEKEQNRWMMFPIEVVKGDKWKLINHLEDNGISTRELVPLYQKITKSYFGSLLDFQTNFPVASRAYENGFYIASHQYLTDEDIGYMEQVFKNYFN